MPTNAANGYVTTWTESQATVRGMMPNSFWRLRECTQDLIRTPDGRMSSGIIGFKRQDGSSIYLHDEPEGDEVMWLVNISSHGGQAFPSGYAPRDLVNVLTHQAEKQERYGTSFEGIVLLWDIGLQGFRYCLGWPGNNGSALELSIDIFRS